MDAGYLVFRSPFKKSNLQNVSAPFDHSQGLVFGLGDGDSRKSETVHRSIHVAGRRLLFFLLLVKHGHFRLCAFQGAAIVVAESPLAGLRARWAGISSFISRWSAGVSHFLDGTFPSAFTALPDAFVHFSGPSFSTILAQTAVNEVYPSFGRV